MVYQSSWFRPGFPTQLAITINCLHAFLLFGYDQGVFGGLVTNEDFLEILSHPSDGLLGIIVSSYNLGCLSGCALNFMVGGKLGRRHVLWIAMTLLSAGAVLQASAYGIPQMMVGRIITGFGVGIDTSTVPMYQAELCRSEVRGRLVTSEVLFTALGIVIAYFFAYGLDFVGGAIAWRLPIAAQIIPAIVISVVLVGLPETPRWLIERGRMDEAEQVMCQVYGMSVDDPYIVREKQEILEALELENRNPFRWSNIFKTDSVKTGRRVLIALMALSFNQFSGINVVVFYIAVVLESSVGLPRNTALIAGGCINLAFAAGSLVPAFFLDKIGRRKPMLIGTLGMALSLMGVSITLSYKGTAQEKMTGYGAIAFFVIYMIFFGASLNAIPWCYGTEVLPLKARAKGTSLAVMANWIWVFVIVMVTPTMIANIAWKTYLVFMTLNFAMIPAIYLFFPETTRLSLEQIDHIFVDRVPNNSSAVTGSGVMSGSNTSEKETFAHGSHIERAKRHT